MNVWTLVACEADKTDLARFLGFPDSFHRSACSENAVWIGIANHLMELEQVNSIRLQPPQRLIDLGCSTGFCLAIDFSHQKSLLPIAIAQRFAHSTFALAAVVPPAVIEKTNSFINSR